MKHFKNLSLVQFMCILAVKSTEGVSTGCRKTKTKVISLANHDIHKVPNEPVITRRNYVQQVPSGRKGVS